jgi:hypothetical protein
MFSIRERLERDHEAPNPTKRMRLTAGRHKILLLQRECNGEIDGENVRHWLRARTAWRGECHHRPLVAFRPLHIFTIDFTVTFTLQQVGWGCYVTNFGLGFVT